MADVRQAAIVAAKWWTEKIGNPNLDSFCNGDRKSNESFAIMLMGHMTAMNHAATPEQLEEFCKLLSQRIDDELNNNVKLHLDCDYDPCNILGEIADSLGINMCLFPYKRHMWITAKSVVVKDGYDRSEKEIYSE